MTLAHSSGVTARVTLAQICVATLNVNPGVTGGVGVLTGSVYAATRISATTGASMATGGDIALADTKVAAAKTLGAALGIDQALLKPDFIDNGSVKPVASMIAGAIV